ncbi:hypothetical protein M011DRAFT_471030 [Sporormia fimetaria CBS 119925]|uniref:RNA polymerase II subunit A C-terminal domain phosphatase n=1 Tax=Sporormia fimetaria CBS 119925 TaxID=1340428 RepID=A0A6A6V2E6_9PLEO|nr:hypothetical protein M011DRAFT_471030 [Sporormia fimetaria CBS 119925]
MKIKSPPNLRYPVTVTELLRQRDDPVERSEGLFKYYYEVKVNEVDRHEQSKEVIRRIPERFNSPFDGTVSEWFIKSGTVIERPGVDIVEIEEPCTHEIQFGGLCANCGKDMTVQDYLTDQRNSERAPINMTHNNVALLVSEREAGRADEEARTRLLSAKKLSLIVDLDQTVIHTTCERTVADWQADENNPNHEAVKDVRSFQLADDAHSNIASNWYYVKKRPGLDEFLERMSQLYEMHVYTMATRAYAEAVAKIIDPTGKYFGDRILSRDENYTDKLKSLQRLFPTNTDMVVIIDDRADVWHYSANLVRVPVFNFFPGAGDINASFLPKQQELITTKAKVKHIDEAVTSAESKVVGEAVEISPTEVEKEPTESANGGLTELEQQIISMGSQNDPEKLEEQVKEQEELIIAQQTERPLLQQQLQLDKEDEEAEQKEEQESSQESENGESQPTPHPKHRHSILHDDDRGLEVVERNLRAVHDAFYDEYRSKKRALAGGRVAELKGSPKKRINNVIPDVKILMPRMKEEVLAGTILVFSGIIPLGIDVLTSDLALWAMSFGAEVVTEVTRYTTHVIANPDRKTTKVRKAARYPNIKIVNVDWMLQCCTRWERVDEEPYLIEMDSDDRGASPADDLDDSDIGVVPDEVIGQPTTRVSIDMTADQWENIDAELEEFMNETDDTDAESDAESLASDASTPSNGTPKKKRKRLNPENPDESGTDDSDASVSSTSRLQKRRKRTMGRVSSLTNMVVAEKSSGLPSPETTGPEEETMEEGGEDVVKPLGVDIDLDDGDYDDGLEAEMLAQFEAAASDDEDGDGNGE